MTAGSDQAARDCGCPGRQDQLRLCRERIAREGWHYVIAYTDAAIGGASRLRPGYQKLLKDSRSGQFDIAEALANSGQLIRKGCP